MKLGTILMKLLTLVCLIFTLLACQSSSQADEKLGIYKGISIELLGEAQDLNEVFGEGTHQIVLKSGGKAEFTLAGETENCNWELNEDKLTFKIEDESLSAIIKEGVIYLDFLGSEMIFAKDGAKID